MKNTKTLKQQIKLKSEEFKKYQQDAFKEMINCIFKEFPEVNSIGFVGYTPSFNDGEPCTFRCDVACPTVNGYDSNMCEWEDGEKKSEKETKEASALADSVGNILSEIPEELFGAVFGTVGFRVTITRDKIEVEEYDCGY